MIKQLRKGREEGFTLIELLVVVAIIGILAAIAIPQYASYKQTAVDAKMKSDLHNAATAMEAFYGSNANTYDGSTVTNLTTYGYRQSENVTLTVSASDQTYSLQAAASGGSQATFTFDSDTGAIN